MAEEKKKTTTKAKPESKPVDLATLKLQLRNLMLEIRTGKEKNTSKARTLRKQIARFMTAQTLSATKD